jgi:hypothetical protein
LRLAVGTVCAQGNPLSSLPAELATMSGLEALDAEMNLFASMPPPLSLLLRNGSLAALRIAGNPFVNTPPASFAVDGRHDDAFSNATQSRCATTDVLGEAPEIVCGVQCRASPPQGLLALNATSSGAIASTVFHRDHRSVLEFEFHVLYNVSLNGTVAVYQRNQRCDWTLRAPPGFVVAVRFRWGGGQRFACTRIKSGSCVLLFAFRKPVCLSLSPAALTNVLYPASSTWRP